ncbi:MAG: hypothetical protein ACRED2_12435 [Methylocella sp.]
MPRFIKTEIAAPRQADRGQEAPAFVSDGPACDTRFPEASDLILQIVTHEVKLLLAVGLGRMAGQLGGRCRKDQPAAAGINRRKAWRVVEERAVRLGVRV